MSYARAQSVSEVLDLFHRWGREHYDEELSQLDHALQTASLAQADGAPDALVAAALLHDVGHLLEMAAPDGSPTPGRVDLHHEARGASWLAGIFGAEVTAPIALHVRAKRYRVAVDPTYAATLSPGSTASLDRQGGPLTGDEVGRFEANPGWRDAVRLRDWDDHGKVEDLDVEPLDSYRDLLEALTSPRP